MEVEGSYAWMGKTTDQVVPVLGNLECDQTEMVSESRRVLPLRSLDEPQPLD
jgi:hypothetical protein